MKRIASLLLAACLLAAPQLTGKAQAEGFALSDFGARGTALTAAWLPARTILPPWLGIPLGSLSSPVPK